MAWREGSDIGGRSKASFAAALGQKIFKIARFGKALLAPLCTYRARRAEKQQQQEAQRYAYALLCQRWAAYTKLVLTQVHFFPDYKMIEAELVDHLESRREDDIASGSTPEEAREQAIANMGDALEVGQALNRVHSPLLGWVWLALKSCAMLFACMLVFRAYDFCSGSLCTYLNPYSMKKDVALVETIPLEGSVTRYGYRYCFDEVRYYDDNSLELCYTVYYNPFGKRIVWSDMLNMSTYTAQGDKVDWESGGGSGGGGWINPHQLGVTFTEDAPEVRFLYLSTDIPEQGILIDLEIGEVVA